MMRLYLDSAPIIYHVERTVPFAVAVDAQLTAPGVVLVSSELARLECFVLPLRNGDTAREDEFDMFFKARMDDMVDFTGAVFRRAAKIRVPRLQDCRRTAPGRCRRGRLRRVPDQRRPTGPLPRALGRGRVNRSRELPS